MVGGLLLTGCRVPAPATDCRSDEDCPGSYTCNESYRVCVGGAQSHLRILTFVASPPSIDWGDGTELSWTTEAATSCTLDGESVEVNGSALRSPLATRSYELECRSDLGTVRQKLIVEVSCQAPQVVPGSDAPITSLAALQALVEPVSGTCFVVSGSLRLHDIAGLTDLGLLQGLIRVMGMLELKSLDDLESLDGLESLQEIQDDLYLGTWLNADQAHHGNASLRSLQGLSGLREVHDNVRIQLLPVLQSLDGLEQLTRIGGFLTIQQNTLLESLRGLRRLESVGGSLYLGELGSLSSLEGLEALELIGRSLHLSALELLEDISALAGLGGNIMGLSLVANPRLVGLTGLEGIGQITEWLEVERCNRLADLDPLTGKLAPEMVRVRIWNNDALVQLSGLTGVERLVVDQDCSAQDADSHYCPGSLAIAYNDALTHIGGLSELTSIGGELYVAHNPELAEIDSLVGLVSVVDDLQIVDNIGMAAVGPLTSLATIGDDLYITSNDSLVDLTGLSGLRSIGEDLVIDDNDQLEDLDGLQGISAIPEMLFVVDNQRLVNLNPLSGVSSLGLGLRIEDNAALTEIGLDPTCTFTGTSFEIFENPFLPTLYAVDLSEAWGVDPNDPGLLICGNLDGAACQ